MLRQMAFRPQFATKVLGSCSREPPTRICTSAGARGKAMNTMREIRQSGPCLILVTDCCMRRPRTKRGYSRPVTRSFAARQSEGDMNGSDTDIDDPENTALKLGRL